MTGLSAGAEVELGEAARRLALRLETTLPSPGAPAWPGGLVEPLTDREMDVLRCLGVGMSNADIEKALVISRNTVRTHLKNLYAKLDVSDRKKAVDRARAIHLI